MICQATLRLIKNNLPQKLFQGEIEFGLAVLISFAYTVSSNKKSIDWKQIAAGVGLQIVFAIIVILVPGGREFFDFISRMFVKIIDFAMSGVQYSYLATWPRQ